MERHQFHMTIQFLPAWIQLCLKLPPGIYNLRNESDQNDDFPGPRSFLSFICSIFQTQSVSIVLSRHLLCSFFKGLVFKQTISKAILITEWSRNKWRVNKPSSKFLDTEVAVTKGLLSDYNLFPNLYFQPTLPPAPDRISDFFLSISFLDLHFKHLLSSPLSRLKRSTSGQNWVSPHSPDASPSMGFLSEDPFCPQRVCILLWENTCGSGVIVLTFTLERHSKSRKGAFSQCLLTLPPPCLHLQRYPSYWTFLMSLPFSYSLSQLLTFSSFLSGALKSVSSYRTSTTNIL